MIFLRHPKPRIAPGICYGRLDVGLTESAAAEIAGAVKRLPPVAHLVTSPAQRCTRLAEAIATAHGVEAIPLAALAELDFGTWEGEPWDSISRTESDLWAADPWHIAPPGGETFAQLHARVSETLAALPAQAVIVTHAGVIRAARMILTGARFDHVFAEKIPYASPIVLQQRGT
ncbi:MAG: alpha-ribazole phosphatase family protein [Pseudomonadota bacterium]